MLPQIAHFLILGKPLIFYLGILTLLSFLFTATIATLRRTAINIIPFKWHPRLARISIAIALIHAILALSVYV